MMKSDTPRIIHAFIKGARTGAILGAAIPFAMGIALVTVTQDVTFLWWKIGESAVTTIAWPTIIVFSSIAGGLHGVITALSECWRQKSVNKEFEKHLA